MTAQTTCAFEQLCQFVRETALLESVEELLGWDERTMMPAQAGAYRAEQITYLAGVIHRRRTDAQVGRWLEQLTHPLIGQEILDQLNRLREQGKAILMTTHDIFRAKMIADRVGIMKQGRLVAMRERANFKHADLEEIYMQEMQAEVG